MDSGSDTAVATVFPAVWLLMEASSGTGNTYATRTESGVKEDVLARAAEHVRGLFAGLDFGSGHDLYSSGEMTAQEATALAANGRQALAKLEKAGKYCSDPRVRNSSLVAGSLKKASREIDRFEKSAKHLAFAEA